MRQRLIALGAALVLAVATVTVVFAHPALARSDPPANAALAESPPTISVWFDEAIEPQYGALAVYDANGQRVDNFDTQFVPDTQPGLRLTVPPLPSGSYVVTWRVISLGDGHSVGGAFAFGVGVPPDTAAASAASAQANANGQPDLTTNLLRYLSLLAQAVLVGALVFRALVWQPALAAQTAVTADPDEYRRWLTVLADAVVGALVIGTLGALYVQARATGVIFWELFGTRWGMIWIARLAVALLAAVMMEGLLLAESPKRLGLGLTLGGALLLTTALTSHSGAKPGLLGPLADATHLLATSVWTGGLVLLPITLASLRSLDATTRAQLTADVVARFSGVAAASVGLIVASGAALTVTQVPTWAGLLLTPYGRALLIKLLGVTVALGFGVYNSLGSRQRSLTTISLEALVVLSVVFGAAVLVDLPPAAVAALAPDEASVLAFTAPAGDMTLTGQVRPARLGNNVFDFTLTTDGQPVRGLPIELVFTPVGGGGLTSRLALAENPAGNYAATSAPFTRVGPWDMLAIITPTQSATLYLPFRFVIGPDDVLREAGAAWPWPVRAVDWLNQHTPLVLIGLVLVVVAGWSWTAWRVALGVRFGWVRWLLIGVALAALVWMLWANQ